MKAQDLKIKIFGDGASLQDILELNKLSYIKGFTTNPTLMRKAGIKDYTSFAKEILTHIKTKPVSFEVFADDFDEMYVQAMKITSWGENVFVKIPVMNTKKEYSYELIQRLTSEGVKLNVTAMFTLEQMQNTTEALQGTAGAFVSVFAGRIADTGVDPVPIMQKSLEIIKPFKNIELLWASPRELLNVIQADEIGCHIITATTDILKKLESLDKDLEEFSQETVQMFYRDASAAGYNI